MNCVKFSLLITSFGVPHLRGLFFVSDCWNQGEKETLRKRGTPNQQAQEFARTNLDDESYGRTGYNFMRDPFTAGLLSLIIPGVGQLYNGRILAGILWLIITPGFWIGSGGTLGWICHIVAAYTAYSYAKDHPIRG